MNTGKWLEPESNRRHEDFQSSALPTELSSLGEEGEHSGAPRGEGKGFFE